MDPLSTLSVAAAVVQFVDFSQRLLSETWNVYRDGSGQTLTLNDLSLVVGDVLQLSTVVNKTLEKQQQGAAASRVPVAQDADDILIRTCRECGSIATEIQNILANINPSFQSEIKSSRKPKGSESRSVGECFRLALKRRWNSKKIEEMESRLDNIRQHMMTSATISIWSTSRDTKGWEQQFSQKLDKMIAMLEEAVDKTQGPVQKIKYRSSLRIMMGFSDIFETQDLLPDQEIGLMSPETAPRRFNAETGQWHGSLILTPSVTKQITRRLWSKDWKPDALLLSTFPEGSRLSATDLKSFIINSLHFDSMDNRVEAITSTFRSTYDWVFNPSPRLSETGELLWSSLPNWLESNSRLPFWITGKPGSGKSTMMKYIANHLDTDRYLRGWSQEYPLYKITYYAWKPGTDLNKSEEGLIRTLLYQVLQNNPDLIPILCPRRWTLFHTIHKLRQVFFPPWTRWELNESFSYLWGLAESTMRLAIFIDGLDEFDVAPVELCSVIQRIAQNHAVKICVASRSWPEFSDAFTHSPLIEMHLLTNGDIGSFVFGHFEQLKAFTELNDLYQNGGNNLLDMVVFKAHGVFLWTTLVTQTILEALTEGASLQNLQAILDKMPTEIEDLYDAIYSTIPTRLLSDMSATLQIFDSACTPVDWITLWLADETRGVDLSIAIDVPDIDKLFAPLKRRLGVRTRGILELVQSTKTVEYLHRTASEWVKKPRVLEQLRARSPKGFDPYMCLLRAEIIQAEVASDKSQTKDALWKRVTQPLLYASLVDSNITREIMLIDAVDQFRRAISKMLPSFLNNFPSACRHWPTYLRPLEYRDRIFDQNIFDDLVMQFAILPYIRCKYEEYPKGFHAVSRKSPNFLLEQAIFGFPVESAPDIATGDYVSRITHSQRLELVAFLLEKGVRRPGILSLIMEAESHSCSSCIDALNCHYYNDVKDLIQSNKATGATSSGRMEKVRLKFRNWMERN